MNETLTSNVTTGNGSSAPVPQSDAWHLPTEFKASIASLQILVIVFALVGNLLVCIAIILHERLRSSTTNYFIFSLAVSDIMTASVPMALDVDTILKDYRWTHGEFVCDFLSLAYLIAAPASILNLLAVTVVRYQQINRPLSWGGCATPKRSLLVIASIWLYTTLFAFVGLSQWPFSDHSISNGFCIFNVQHMFANIVNIVNFLLPTVVVCALHFKIYQIAQAHAHHIRRFTTLSENSNGGTPITSERKAISRNIKAAKTVAIIVFTFLICWMPYNLVSLVKGFWVSLKIPWQVQPGLQLLAFANSAMNPFLYAYRNREFRESFRRLSKLQTTWV